MHVYTSSVRLNKQKKEALQQMLFSASFRVTILLGIIVLGILYVLQMTALSSKGFVITDLQKNLTVLKHESRNLDVQIAEYRSMASVQERLSPLELVEVDNIMYVDMSSKPFALK